MKLDSKEKLIWETSRNIVLPPTPDKDEAWSHLTKQIKMPNHNVKIKQTLQKKVHNGKQYWLTPKFQLSYALGSILIAFFLVPSLKKLYSTETIITKTTERRLLELSDGSNITLHSGSKIIYDKDYNKTHRKISLNGEAYFKIAHSTFPLIIDTRHGQVTVLGTMFNLCSRNDIFEIGVTEGAVKFSNKNATIQLTKGQIIKTDSNFVGLNIQNIDYTNYPDWMENKIYCDKTKLFEICSEIERIFNVQFIFSKPYIKKTTVTGLIHSSNLQTVLKTLSLLTTHDFKLVGDTVKIN